MKRSLVLCLALVGCGGGGDDPPGDSAPAGDAPPATVMSVTCDGTEVEEIETTGGFRFSPNDITIAVGDVVKVTNNGQHSMVPGASPTDSGLRATFSTSTCLKFTAVGTFNYKCNPHSSMTGKVTVE
jgi:plastocyanin